MVILGLLLVLGVVGVAGYAIWNNQSAFEAAAGTVDVFGYSMQLSNGEVFLTGAAAGALLLFGLSMLFRGVGRRARHRASTRRELRELRRQNAAAQAEAPKETAPVRTPAEKREDELAKS